MVNFRLTVALFRAQIGYFQGGDISSAPGLHNNTVAILFSAVCFGVKVKIIISKNKSLIRSGLPMFN
jgi:hypothetical protein